jgi:hypothetical protein
VPVLFVVMLSVIMLSACFICCYAECNYAECLFYLLLCYAKCRVARNKDRLKHRDKTRVQMPAKIFPQLKVKC